MTTLSPGLDAALSADAVLAFGAVEIALPSGAFLRLLDGAGVVSFGGQTFAGADATYGTLGGVDAFADGVDGDAPKTTVRILPPTNTAAAALAAPPMQGCSVALWVGVLSPATGLPLGDPDLRFSGVVDVPTLRVGQNSRTVELTVVSAFEAMFADDEGVRLSAAWHRSVWPGEGGLDAVTSVLRHLPWGSDAPKPAVSAGVTGVSVLGGRGAPGLLPF